MLQMPIIESPGKRSRSSKNEKCPVICLGLPKNDILSDDLDLNYLICPMMEKYGMKICMKVQWMQLGSKFELRVFQNCTEDFAKDGRD